MMVEARAKLAVLLAGLVLLASCASPPAGGNVGVFPIRPELAPTYERAREEPPLTWYSSQDPSLNEAVVESFKRQYPGVEINAMRLATGALATRYAQERDAGTVTAGVVTLADPAFVAGGNQAGWFESPDKTSLPSLRRVPEKFFESGAVTTGINAFGIGYNTTEVTTPPRSWEDVPDPKYGAGIILGDPRNVPSYLALANLWRDRYGPEFLVRIAVRQPKLVDSMVPGMQQLGAGEGAVALPTVMSTLKPLRDEGAPIDFVMPDVTTGNEFTSMISTGTSSPNAARLFYDYLLTDEGQKAFNGTTGSSPLGNIQGTAPLPANYVSPNIEELSSVRGEILRELGLS